MKTKLSPADLALFRAAMRGVKPLDSSQQKSLPQTSKPSAKLKAKVEFEPPPQAVFSDHAYLPLVESDEALDFACPDLPFKLIRALRRGTYPLEARLDLHGMIVEEARVALYQFLLASQAAGLRVVLIIHGKGRGSAKPILKNKVNLWLRQAPQVLAFCSAQAKDGGRGAIYVYLKAAK